ncbi:MAG TPA: maleylpyruvate isomerase family mycothiol-dependent enzyme [Streptosporangiaceae bacterium]|nr:maleylpyruvate isomerase family mycothiol-dependent enzyme [Streptosporangiaceae bacterium]
MTTPGFAQHLAFIEERSAALRTAAAAAPAEARVPGCPDWHTADLVGHLGEVQRFWAAIVAAGPAGAPPDDVPGRTPEGDLLTWSAACTADLLAALREAGPDQPCWTWWGAPGTAGAVARHQAQEAAVHAWDAQQTAGRSEPLPAEAAVDAVDEFLSVSLGAAGSWKSPAARVGLAADEGSSWLIDLTESGATATRGEVTAVPPPGAVLAGSASDLLLALFGRLDPGALRMTGDADLIRGLLGWAPTD